MTFRKLDKNDIADFLKLAEEFSVQCSKLPFSRQIAEANFSYAVDNNYFLYGAFNLEHELVGFAYGVITNPLFSEVKAAFLQLLFVKRGQALAARGLIKALEHEAHEKGASEIFVGTIAADYDGGALMKLYTLLGYKLCGGDFKKEIQKG